MSAVATRGAAARSTTVADRLIAAVPLVSIYLWLSIIYCVEAWKRVTPWLFTDELEMTQISRAIAATGKPARRGEPYSFHSLYPVLTAPVWWIHDVATAYSALKYLDVLVMTSVIFPAYLLARLVVGRLPALFAATGAAAIPALAYSSWIVEETFAYPYAALCFYLIAKALIVRGRWWIAAATAASLLAPAIREQLYIVPVAGAIAAGCAFWSTEWFKERRSHWSVGDWVGVLTLFGGGVILISALGSHWSPAWYSVTQYYKYRLVVYGDWAVGAFAVGLGVIPFVAGLASLFPVRGEPRSREVRMFRCVGVGVLVAFGIYTAMKAAYLSTVFETRITERNFIYVAPVLFAGTALIVERRRVNLYALAAATAYALYLIVGTPLHMQDQQVYSDALGLAVLQQANRYFAWTTSTGQWILIAMLVLGSALLYAITRLRARAALVAALVLGAGVLAWNVTAEIAAGAGTVSISRDLVPTLNHPFTWVDDVADGKPTIYLAQGVADQNPEWLLEFWNRSINTVSSLDGTLRGPGPTGAPNMTRTGQLFATHDPKNPGPLHDYAVEDWPCVDFVGTLMSKHFYRSGGARPGEWRLIRLTKPNRLRATCSGLYPDGWSGTNDSQYFRFAGKKPGVVRVTLSRQGYPSSKVRIQVTDIAERDYSVLPGKVRRQLTVKVDPNKVRVVDVPVPASGFAIRVLVDSKFIPRDVDPAHTSDPRLLGALVSYRFIPATK